VAHRTRKRSLEVAPTTLATFLADRKVTQLPLLIYSFTLRSAFTARSELRKVLFLALSVTILFVSEVSREPLNGFAPNSQEDVFGPSLGRV